MRAAKLDRYREQYFDFRNSNIPDYVSRTTRIIFGNNFCKVRFYSRMNSKENGVSSKRDFLISPSIFNSPEILFISTDDSFIDELLQHGNVYLVDWKESVNLSSLAMYARCLKEIIDYLSINNQKKLDLIGHCLGGNISIAASQNNNKISSLTLLSTPWDFKKMFHFAYGYSSLNIETILGDCKLVPKLYTQILFFLLLQENHANKVEKFSNTSCERKRDIYLRVEDWLHSGSEISVELHKEIIYDFIGGNKISNNSWYFNEEIVSPGKIIVRNCLVCAKNDRLVPINASICLQKLLKDNILIEVQGGHINYIINDSYFRKKYFDWLLTKD